MNRFLNSLAPILVLALPPVIAVSFGLQQDFNAPFWGGDFEWIGQMQAALAVGVVMLAANLVRPSRQGMSPGWDWPSVWILAGIAILALSVVNSEAALVSRLHLGFAAACGAAFLGFRGRSDEGIYWVVGSALAGAVVISLFGIRHYAETAAQMEGGARWREFSVFINPNACGAYLATILPAAFLVGLRARGSVLGAATILIAPVVLAALMLTGSRAALGAGVVGCVAALGLLVIGKLRLRSLSWQLGVLAVLVALVGFAAKGPLLARGEQARADSGGIPQRPSHSNAYRAELWKTAWRMFEDRPLTGFGAGTFEQIFPQYAEVGYTKMAHNTYLQTAAETGLGGLAWFGAGGILWIAAAFGAIRRLRAADDPRDQWRLCLLGGLLGAATHNALDFGWSVFPIALVSASYFGVCFPAGRREPQEALEPSPSVGAPLWPLAGFLCAAVAIWANWYPLQGKLRAREAQETAQTIGYRDALAQFQQAIQLSPKDAEIRRQMGPVAFAVAQNDYPDRNKEQGDAIYEGPYYAARYLEKRNVANYLAAAALAQGMPTSGFAIDLYQRAQHLAPRWTDVSGPYLVWLLEWGPTNGSTAHDEKLHNLRAREAWQREVGRLADQIISVAEGKVEQIRAVEGLVDKYYVIAYAARPLPEGRAYNTEVAAKSRRAFGRLLTDYLNWMCRLGGQLAAAQGRLDEEYPVYLALLAGGVEFYDSRHYFEGLKALRARDSAGAEGAFERVLRYEGEEMTYNARWRTIWNLQACRAAQQLAHLSADEERREEYLRQAEQAYSGATRAFQEAERE